MSTGAIIAIAVVAALILIALLVLLPRMRAKAAERKQEQARVEAERRLERERQEAADQHRSASETQLKRAELAEHEAKKQRAEAEIHAKRAELHEEGLADEDLASGGSNGRVPSSDRDFGFEERGREPGVREIDGGRAHEPPRDEYVSERPDSDAEDVHTPADGGDKEYDADRSSGDSTGARRITRAEEPDSGEDPDRGPLR